MSEEKVCWKNCQISSLYGRRKELSITYGDDNRNGLVSIIIPIYNVCDYLERCIISVLNQTYRNIEIILVDDGSTDGSEIICDSFEKRYEEIQVIHKKNGGLSDARNAGIDNARGEYLMFVDSDDFIAPEMVQILLHELKEKSAQVAVCSVEKVYGEEIPKSGKEYNVIIMDGRESVLKLYTSLYSDMVVAWNKLYRRECFHNLRFPIGKIHEDEFVTYKILYNLQKCVYVSKPLYYYFQRPNSICGEKYSLKRLDRTQALEERLEYFLGKEDALLSGKTLKKLLDDIAWNIIQIKKYFPDNQSLLKELRKKYRETYKSSLKKVEFNFSDKLKIYIFLVNEKLYEKVKERWEKNR